MDCLPQVHVVAIHAEHGYRSEIPGLGALCRKGDFLAGAGAYRNSLGKSTAYIAGGWQPLTYGSVRAGVIVGLATGYRPHPVPMAAAFVSVWHVHFTLIPKVEGKTPATAGISFTVPWQ
jgi:hypothetical protein